MDITGKYAIEAARPEPRCEFCGGSQRLPGGTPVKLTLHTLTEPQQSEVELHRECIWPYLDTHPVHALSRFPLLD